MSRLRLLWALWLMPDEAFGWFVLWAARSSLRMPMAFKYPDGIGGFQSGSKRGIERLRNAAERFILDMRDEDPAA